MQCGSLRHNSKSLDSALAYPARLTTGGNEGKTSEAHIENDSLPEITRRPSRLARDFAPSNPFPFMKRIYQGQITGMQFHGAAGEQAVPANQNWEQALWDHHGLFHDAVNYYLVCLLALARPGNPVYAIREKLDAHNGAEPDELMVWRTFRRRGCNRPGLRDSVAKYLTPGNDEPTTEECFAAVLAGNPLGATEEGRAILNEGLAQLLGKCTGESGCRNSAKEYLPRFTKPDFKGNFEEDTARLNRAEASKRLPFYLHDPATTPNSPALDEFGVLSIALPNPKRAELTGAEARDKLLEFSREWSARLPDGSADWRRLEAKITALGDSLAIPGYTSGSAKGENRFQLYAMFLFCFVEKSDFTLGLLRQTTRRPVEGEEPPPRSNHSATAGDPIRIARGGRGYVFRAFTSLKQWGGDTGGDLKWPKFDMAAFCEALKALHQVEAKAKQRAEERSKKQALLDYQRGRIRRFKPTANSEDATPPPVLAGDPRISRLEQLLNTDLQDEYEMSEGVAVAYGLHPRTIRGFREIRKRWISAVGNAPFSEAARATLIACVRSFQSENPGTVGSARLFEALAEESNWIIWREPSAAEQQSWRENADLPESAEFALDPLQALTDERELKDEIERLSGPIRFTPADAEHSRRQFYFSDVSQIDKRNRFRPRLNEVEVELAVRPNGHWTNVWVTLQYSAPRLLRDQLPTADEAGGGWQQAMMAALNLRAPLKKGGEAVSFADCAALSLMPDISPDGEKRLLLNFPVELDGEAIANQLGRSKRWETLQFGGADDESYWLRWPKTWIDETKVRRKAAPPKWWLSKEPFSVLGVDLGQRDAAACALVQVSPGNCPTGVCRHVGSADGVDWWATVRSMNMLRLPGENAKVMRDGRFQEELSGSRGRSASIDELKEAGDICARLGFVADTILGANGRALSFPELNDRLLFSLRSAQSRLARLQSWSCVAHADVPPARREGILRDISEAKDDPLGLKPLATAGNLEAIASTLREVILQERTSISAQLVRVADRILPLRGRRWEWVARPESPSNHMLRATAPDTDPRRKLVAGQRGLSLARVEQLESLRQRCQSLNRALMQVPGTPSKLGRRSRGVELPDPCPDLLDRLDALKEQRVNQTAHLILAQALGVRLRIHQVSGPQRTRSDSHGEYERIPGREPVDFLVLENLDRYLASQGRSRSENSRLMKWCHRAILLKLKQLCEPYGLRVLETPAAYSSKFSSRDGTAGFRAVEVTPDDLGSHRWRKHSERLADPGASLSRDEREESTRLMAFAERLKALNQDLIARQEAARSSNQPFRPKWRTLLAPQQLGPIFVPAVGKPLQADINAAINIALRAIASPDVDDIHLRIRAARSGDKFVVRAENTRERARWGSAEAEIGLPTGAGAKEIEERRSLLTEARVNFFFDPASVAAFDHGKVRDAKLAVTSGRGLWGTLRREEWAIVGKINNDRLAAHGLGRPFAERVDL